MVEEILLSIFIMSYLFTVYLKGRELGRLSRPASKTYLRLAPPEQIEKTRSYNRDKLMMSIVEATVSLLKDLYIIKKRVLQSIYSKYMEGGSYGEVLFLLAYFHFERVFDVPFSAVTTFYIEAKHGFNKTTAGTFILDFMKTTAVLTAIVAPFAYAALKIIRGYFGSFFYIYLWVFSSVFQIVLVIAFPIFIQPLFNKFEEMKDCDLKNRIHELANRVGFTAKKILVMDASRRSGHSNAYFIGLTKEKRIVLFDTLLKQVDEDEILAILCHEVGHWKYSHTAKMVVLALAIQLVYFYLFNISLNSKTIGKAMFYGNESLIIRILYFFMILGILTIPIDIIRNAISRCYERQADRFAVGMGYGRELSSGLVKLCEKNNSNMDPDPVYAAVVHTHPTVIERIRLIEDEMNKCK